MQTEPTQGDEPKTSAHVGLKASAPTPGGEQVPPDAEWFTKRLIRAREAVIACAQCRNAVSRGIEDMALQMDTGQLQIGTPKVQASGAIVPRLPPGAIIEIIKLIGFNGGGRQIPLYVGPETILLSELELGRTVTSLAEETSSRALRALAQKVREKASSCCRAQVYKRLLPQGSKRKWVKVKSHRVRVSGGLFGL